MADPCVDLTEEHGGFLEIAPAHVVGFTCSDDGGEPDKPCRPFVLTTAGRYQLGDYADADAADVVIAAVKAKLWPAP